MTYMYIKAIAAQQRCKTLTVACLNIKTIETNFFRCLGLKLQQR